MAWKLIKDSFHVMKVTFVDGNKRTLYSIDWRYSFFQYRSAEIGFSRYRKRMSEWGSRAVWVSIYINDGKKTGKLIEEYKNGIKIH